MTQPTPSPLPSTHRRLFSFALSELKGLLLAFWRPFWKVSLALTLLLFGLLAYLIVTGQSRPDDPPLAVKLVLALGLSVTYAAPVGAWAGGLGVAWRLCGWGILVPVLLIPLAVLLSTWLLSGWMATEGREALDALSAAADARGFPETKKAAESIGKAAHGGAELLAVVAILLVPFVAYDSVAILLDGTFLVQFAQFVGAVLLGVCLGLIPSALFSLVVTSVVAVRRLRRRYRAFCDAFELPLLIAEIEVEPDDPPATPA
jgi:hypothetical protein